MGQPDTWEVSAIGQSTERQSDSASSGRTSRPGGAGNGQAYFLIKVSLHDLPRSWGSHHAVLSEKHEHCPSAIAAGTASLQCALLINLSDKTPFLENWRDSLPHAAVRRSNHFNEEDVCGGRRRRASGGKWRVRSRASLSYQCGQVLPSQAEERENRRSLSLSHPRLDTKYNEQDDGYTYLLGPFRGILHHAVYAGRLAWIILPQWEPLREDR